MPLFHDRIVAAEHISISPQDRGYNFGDGIYEVFRSYGGKLFEPEAHLFRLEHSAREIGLTLPYSIERILHLVEQMVREEDCPDGLAYVQITRGSAPRAHPFPQDAVPVLYGFCQPFARPLSDMEHGISVISAADIRWLRCDIKSLNLLPNVLARQQAAARGSAEVVLHRDATVTECSASNVMIVKDGRILTHPANQLILHGITRAVVLRLAASLMLPLDEQQFTLRQLMQADEVFITGTTVEVMPVVSIDGQPIGAGRPGTITRQLQQSFSALVTTL